MRYSLKAVRFVYCCPLYPVESPQHSPTKIKVSQVGKRSEPLLGRRFAEGGHDWRRMMDLATSEEEESDYEHNFRTEGEIGSLPNILGCLQETAHRHKSPKASVPPEVKT